ncbi:hypothetical protein ACFX2I_008797 [Malus domestica]
MHRPPHRLNPNPNASPNPQLVNPSIDSSFDQATLICESIARKVFSHESYKEYDGIEEAHYRDVVPQIVYWDMNDDDLITWVRYAEQGVSRMSCDCNEFVQFLLDCRCQLCISLSFAD